MSTQDDINISDDEFEAFLKGEGELALMLRELPQAQPSAQLDAAILAAAKAELATSPAVSAAVVQPVQQAANDPVIPGKTASSNRRANRWRIPLGLAASLLVTVQLVRMEIYDERMLPGTPQLLVEKEPAPTEVVRQPVETKVIASSPPVAVKILPPPGYEPPPGISAKPAAPAPATAEAIEAAQATAAAAAASQPEEKKLSRAHVPDEKRVTVPPIAPPPALAPAPVVSAPAFVVPAAPVSNYAAPAPTPAPAPARMVAPVAAPSPRPIDAPQSAPAATSARAAATPEEQSVQRVEITGSMIRRIDKETAESVQVITSQDIRQSEATTVASDADAQLAKIDALLKSGSTPEALSMWRKFRHAYPDYKVSDELRAKIDALLNQQTIESGP